MSTDGWTPMGYITDESVFTSTEDLNLVFEELLPLTTNIIEFTTATTETPWWFVDFRDIEPRYTLAAAMTRTVSLRTGPLRGRRVDHARRLRLDKWKRRRQRRHGIPAAVMYQRVMYPQVRMVTT